MASQSIRLDDALVETLREDAARANRSISSQAEHYLKIGRSIARSPNFDHDHIELASVGGIEVEELSLEEQEAFFAEFRQLLDKQGGSHDYWEQRRRNGLGVGETPDGQLVRQLPDGRVAAY